MDAAKDILLDASHEVLQKICSPCSLKILNFNEFTESSDATFGHPIVEGLLHKEELLLCSATAKTGKTFLAIELARSVITGTPFLNEYKTNKGKVLYIETELTSYFLKERLSKMFNIEDESSKNLLICKEVVKIDTTDGSLELKKALAYHQPDLVILDPFYRLHSKNEDKAQEMAQLLSQIKSLAQQFKTAFFILHHEGKKGESTGNQVSHRPRGSSAFADVPDVIVSMTRVSDKKACRLSIENRNFKGEQLTIKLREDLTGWDVLSRESETVELDVSTLFKETLVQQLERSHLLKKLNEATGLSERSCLRKIDDALKLKIILKSHIDNKIWFSLRTNDN